MSIRGTHTVNEQKGEKAYNNAGSDLLAEANAGMQRLSQNANWVPRYIVRPRPVGDYNSNRGTIRIDGRQHVINFNHAISSENPFLIKIRVEVSHPTTTNWGIDIWPENYPVNPHRVYLYTQNANAYNCAHFDLPINSNKNLVYKVTGNTNFNLIQITCIGHWA